MRRKKKQQNRSIGNKGKKRKAQPKKKTQSTQFLTGKEIKRILENPDNSDLLDFTKDFYALLAAANPDRRTFPRKKESRRLDAFARLLVGNETCAAVAFDGEHLLIATNKDEHEKLVAGWTVDLKVKHGLYINCIFCEPILRIKFTGYPELPPLFGREIFYRPFVIFAFDKNGREILRENVLRPNVDVITFDISPDIHRIPNLPNITINCSLKSEIPLHSEDIGKLAIIPRDKISSTPFKNCRTPFDPLRRRAETLIHHLNFVVKANNCTDDIIKKEGMRLAEQNREQVLMQSLSWEIALWYRQEHKCENYSEFIGLLNTNFVEFKQTNTIMQTTSAVVKTWWSEVCEKIRRKQIRMPVLIQANPERFITRAYRYFIDLGKLEAYVVENTNLSAKLTKISRGSEQDIIKVLDGYEENLHAEMRILLYLLINNRTVPYIATSKLCCCHCNLVLQQHGITTISGRHGKIFAKCALNNKLIKDEQFLKRLFDDTLYEKYLALKGKEIRLPNQKKCSEKNDVALQIIQAIANLQSEDLVKLGIATHKLWNDEYELANESDEEGLDNETASLSMLPADQAAEKNQVSQVVSVDELLPPATRDSYSVSSSTFFQSSSDDQLKTQYLSRSVEENSHHVRLSTFPTYGRNA